MQSSVARTCKNCRKCKRCRKRGTSGTGNRAIGVGVAFGVGLMVTCYFVQQTVPGVSLREAFLVPALAAAAALCAFVRAAKVVRWDVLRPSVTVERALHLKIVFRNEAG
jgi:hypothetical protein